MNEPMKKDFTLQELIAYKSQLEKEVTEKGEEVPEEIVQLTDVANQLLAGKIDQAGRFRAGLIAGIEAAQQQAEYLSEMLETTERLMKEAVTLSGKPRIDGTTYSLKVQNNSRASTIIEENAQVPDSMKKMSMSMSDKYDSEKYLLWACIVLNKEVLKLEDLTADEKVVVEKALKVEVSKTMVEEALKKDPKSIPGARLERGTHLRVEIGKVKPKQIEEKV